MANRNVERLRACAREKKNKKCFDCGANGPHANVVVDPYYIFVCQRCAGLHRSFNHKVKGVSMSTFSKAEVESVENGGNAKLRSYYLAKYNPETYRFDPNNEKKVKDKIRRTFEIREWYSDVPKSRKRRKRRPRKAAGSEKSHSNHENSEMSIERPISPSHEEDESEETGVVHSPSPKRSSQPDILDLIDLSAIPSPIVPVADSGDDDLMMRFNKSVRKEEINPFDEEDPEDSDEDYNPFTAAPPASRHADANKEMKTVDEDKVLQAFVRAIEAIRHRYELADEEFEQVVKRGLQEVGIVITPSPVKTTTKVESPVEEDPFREAARVTKLMQGPIIADRQPQDTKSSNPFTFGDGSHDDDGGDLFAHIPMTAGPFAQQVGQGGPIGLTKSADTMWGVSQQSYHVDPHSQPRLQPDPRVLDPRVAIAMKDDTLRQQHGEPKPSTSSQTPSPPKKEDDLFSGLLAF